MPRRTPIFVAVASAMLMAAMAGSAQDKPSAQIDPTKGKTKLKLKSIRETRQLELVKPDSDEVVFSMSQEKPGLLLTFDVKLPGGRRLVAVEQPSSIEARDSTGADLVGIEKNFSGELQYLELPSVWHDEPISEVFAHLAVPQRTASTFNVIADFKASVYTGVQADDVKISKEWVDLDPQLFGGQKVRVRLATVMESPGIEIMPASANDRIDAVQVLQDGEVVESNGRFSDSQSITYTFDGAAKESIAARFMVRTGFETIPMRIELKDQKLP